MLPAKLENSRGRIPRRRLHLSIRPFPYQVILGGFTNGEWGASNLDGLRDIAAVKLDGEAGTEVWRYQAAASTSSSGGYGVSYVLGVAVDSTNNPVLVGTTYNSLVDGVGVPGDWDFFAIKLNGVTGGELWRVQGGVAFTREGLLGAKVDSSGDLVAAGYAANEDASELNFLVVKLSGSDGSVLWEYAPSTASGGVFHSVDLDDRSHVYVAGGEGAPNFQGKVGTTAVILKLDGESGAERWSYRGTGGDGIMLNSIAADPITGWVVGAGGAQGDWVEGASQGGFDFAAVVLDGDSGAELTRWQDGTLGDDVLEFVEFDISGEFFLGGFSTAAWVGGTGDDEDVVAMKFERLATTVARTDAPSSAPTSSPTAGPTYSPSPPPTLPPSLPPTLPPSPPPIAPSVPSPSPTPGSTAAPATAVLPAAETPSPSAAARDATLLTAAPAVASAEAVDGSGSSEALGNWAVGSIVAGGGLFLALLALCLCSVRRRAKAKMAEIAAAQAKALQVLPVPSTKPQRMVFVDVYPDEDEDAKFTSRDEELAELGGSKLVGSNLVGAKKVGDNLS
ncbi:unnamed protein product [Ectocarpus sp. 6 AP-2014]